MDEPANSAAVLDMVGRGLGALGHAEFVEELFSGDDGEEESPFPKELSNSASSCAERDVRKDGVFDIVGSRAFAVDIEETIFMMNARHCLRRNVRVGP